MFVQHIGAVSRRRIGGVAGTLFVTAVSARAQALEFGPDCADALGQRATLSVTQEPVSGQPFTLLVEGPASSGAALFAGVSGSQWGAVPLPLQLSFLGFPACALNVSPDVIFGFTTDGSGLGNFPLAAWSTGVTVYFQAFVLDVAGDPTNFGTWSRGLAVTPCSGVTANLLTNPGAETGDLSGWTSSGFTAGLGGASSGSYAFDSGGAPFSNAVKSQVVDLAAAGLSAGDVAGHERIVYRTRILANCAVCKPFFAQVRVTARDAQGQSLATVAQTVQAFAATTYFDPFSWAQYSLVLDPVADGYDPALVASLEVEESLTGGFLSSSRIDDSELFLCLGP